MRELSAFFEYNIEFFDGLSKGVGSWSTRTTVEEKSQVGRQCWISFVFAPLRARARARQSVEEFLVPFLAPRQGYSLPEEF